MSDGAAEGSGSARGHGRGRGRGADRHRAVGRARRRGPGDHDPPARRTCAAGTAPLRLNAVPAKAGVDDRARASRRARSRFKSDEVRTHYVEFTRHRRRPDGHRPRPHRRRRAAGREHPADHRPEDDLRARPLQQPDRRPDARPTSTRPAACSSSPASRTSPERADPGRGARPARGARHACAAPLDGRPVTFNYRISNGLAEAEGTITVVELPIARPAAAAARDRRRR